MKIRLNKVHHPVTALGPGRRLGIWFQGCSIRCAGCISQDTWDAGAGSTLEVEDLLDRIVHMTEIPPDGVTITGGEPFDQPAALLELLRALNLWRNEVQRPVDFLAYSGYSLKRLSESHGALLELLDAVIVGPYQQRKPTRRIWRGSDNQTIVPLTPAGFERYQECVSLEPSNPPIQVLVDHAIWLIGVPRAGDMARLESMLEAAGVYLEGPSWRA